MGAHIEGAIIDTDHSTVPIAAVFARQKQASLVLRGSTADQRIVRLRALERAILANQAAIRRALADDLRKPAAEADLAEIMPVLGEIRHAIKHLKAWMQPRKVTPTLMMLGTSAAIRYEPRGVCLIVAPWNYPVQLMLGPLVSAIAAGNSAMLKPSELTPACAAILARIVSEACDPDHVALFEGDASVASALLDLPFDHIFFTGSPAIGKIVMAAAAKHLASVTLELGGKSPAIVDASADLAKAANSLMWGKFINNGQTCIAPDHVYVHEAVLPHFIEHAKDALVRMYGVDAADSPDYCRIVNDRHFARVADLLDDAVAHGARVITGGVHARADRYMAPTLLADADPACALMQEEIFGPILPIVRYRDLAGPLARINDGPKPLALYVYSTDEATIGRVIGETSSGGACINAAMLHILHPNLPFGGVNNSGIGASHGVFGFRAFSHERAVLRDRRSATRLFFPPYTDRVKRLIRLTLRFFT